MSIVSARTKHLLILFYCAASVAFLSVAADWLARYAPDPLTIEPRTAIERITARPGDLFTFTRAVCVSADLVVTVHRELYQVSTGDRFMLPSVSYGAKRGDGCFNVEFSARLPSYLPPGGYEYRPLLIYSVNPQLRVAKPAPIVQIEVTL